MDHHLEKLSAQETPEWAAGGAIAASGIGSLILVIAARGIAKWMVVAAWSPGAPAPGDVVRCFG